MSKSFGTEQYYEDFSVGDEFEAGPVAFPEEEILSFAHQYDPQGFHTDPEFAKEHAFGGLIASGWHVVSKTFCALVDAGFLRGGGMGSPGIDELRWTKPVRPGDELRVTLRVTKTRPSATRSDRGYVDLDFAALNQRGEVVTTYRVVEILQRRHTG